MEPETSNKAISILSQLLTMENILLSVGIYVLMTFVARVARPLTQAKGWFYKLRVLSLLAGALGIIGKMVPGLRTDGIPLAQNVIIGLICSFASIYVDDLIGPFVHKKLDDWRGLSGEEEPEEDQKKPPGPTSGPPAAPA